MHARRLVGLIVGVLIGAGLIVTGGGAAQAVDPPPAYVADVSFNPLQTSFAHPEEEVTTTVKIIAPGDWTPVSGTLQVSSVGNQDLGNVMQQGDSEVHHPGGLQNWTIVFHGTLPEWVMSTTLYYLRVKPVIIFNTNDTTVPPDQRYKQLSLSQPDGWFYSVSGHTRATISGPARIDTGTSLTLTGRLDCYRNGSYSPLPWQSHGPPAVTVEFYDPAAGRWVPQVSWLPVDGPTGTWTYTILSVGGTFKWRATTGGGRQCGPAVSNELTVEAGSGPPPTQPSGAVPGKPGLSVGQVTQSTAALSWSTPGGPGSGDIVGYRFGWESVNGQPQPDWHQEYTLDELVGNNPFVMTNLCAGCVYSMWVEALTGAGKTGERARVDVTTAEAPVPEPPVVVPPTPPNLPPVTPPPGPVAGLTGTVSMAVGNATKPGATGCFNHPWSSVVTMDPAIDYMHIEYDVIDPAGAIQSLEFVSGNPPDGVPQTFNFNVFFCSSLDQAGTYTIKAIAEVDDYEDDNDFNSPIAVAPVTFTLSNAGTTPPPPGAAKVDVDGKVVSDKVSGPGKKGYALKFKSFKLPAGSVQGKRLVWKVKVDGQVKTVIKQDAAEVDRLAVMKKRGTGTHKIVILKNGDKVEVLKIKTG